ncbi:hypothetical protein [Streptomyces sp. KL116D]|uniref:hypothetical protein n=1 Tax=Streptomyces sp. KL116D TaxID=3045152 RepID=UPI003557270A
MCDATHFRIDYVINPYMDTGIQPDSLAVLAEHEAIERRRTSRPARIVTRMESARECPDMVYTALTGPS